MKNDERKNIVLFNNVENNRGISKINDAEEDNKMGNKY